MKNVGKFMWKMTKNMLGSVTCVALIGLFGYFLSKGLNWLTGVVMEFLTTSAKYLAGNWVAVIVVIIALTLGGMIFEWMVERIKNRKKQK